MDIENVYTFTNKIKISEPLSQELITLQFYFVLYCFWFKTFYTTFKKS